MFDVSLTWLLGFMVEEYANAPDDLGEVLPIRQFKQQLQLIGLELDEMWSFVGNKKRKCWTCLPAKAGMGCAGSLFAAGDLLSYRFQRSGFSQSTLEENPGSLAQILRLLY